jgi:hypothetical protein
MRTDRARRQRQLDDITAARLKRDKRDQRERARIREHAHNAQVVAAVTAKLTAARPKTMFEEGGAFGQPLSNSFIAKMYANIVANKMAGKSIFANANVSSGAAIQAMIHRPRTLVIDDLIAADKLIDYGTAKNPSFSQRQGLKPLDEAVHDNWADASKYLIGWDFGVKGSPAVVIASGS